VEVDANGWRFVDDAPALFRRVPNLKPLPDPVRGGSLDVLDSFVNVREARDRRLLKAAIVVATLPHIGRPVIVPVGPAGAGKTTLSRLIKRTLDPTEPEGVRADPQDFLQKASHAFMVVLDNLGRLSTEMTDVLCRLVTGESDSKRRLYSDDEDIIYSLKRAVLANGINLPTERPDFLDRALVVELERISETERRTDTEYWHDFAEAHPAILGAIFDALSGALASNVRLLAKPRLADWAAMTARVYDALGWGVDQFSGDWIEVANSQNQAVIDSSPVARAVLDFMTKRNEFEGSPTELYIALKGHVDSDTQISKAWPSSAQWLWPRIREVQPVLEASGIAAESGRANGRRWIRLRRVERRAA
jgi:hypothetical protein